MRNKAENSKILGEQKLNSFLHGMESVTTENFKKNSNKINDFEDLSYLNNEHYLNKQRELFKGKPDFQNNSSLKKYLYELNFLEEKFDFREDFFDTSYNKLTIEVVELFIKNKYPTDSPEKLKVTLFVITRLLQQEEEDPFVTLFCNLEDPKFMHKIELLVSSKLDFSDVKAYSISFSNAYLLTIKQKTLFEHLIKTIDDKVCCEFFFDLCDFLEPFLYKEGFLSTSLRLDSSLKKRLDSIKTYDKETVFDFLNFEFLLGDDDSFLKNIYVDELWELDNNLYFSVFEKNNNVNYENPDKKWDQYFLKKLDLFDDMIINNSFNHLYFYYFYAESFTLDYEKIRERTDFVYDFETNTFEQKNSFLINYDYVKEEFNKYFSDFKKSYDCYEMYYNEFNNQDTRNFKWYYCDTDVSNFALRWDFLRIEQFPEFYPTFERVGDEDIILGLFFFDHFCFFDQDYPDDDFLTNQNLEVSRKNSIPFLLELENLLFTKSINLEEDFHGSKKKTSYGYTAYSFLQETENSISFKELNLITEEKFEGLLVYEDYSCKSFVKNLFFNEKNSYFTLIYNIEQRWPSALELIDFIADPWCQILSRYWTKPRPSTIFLFGFWCLTDPSVVVQSTNVERVMFIEYLNFTLRDYMDYPLNLMYNDYLKNLRESLYIDFDLGDIDTNNLVLLHGHYKGEKIFFDYLTGFDGYYIPGFFWNEWHFKLNLEADERKKILSKKNLLDALDKKKKSLILNYPFNTKNCYVDKNFYSSFFSPVSFEEPEKTDIYYYGFLINKKYKHFSFFEFEIFKKNFRFLMFLQKKKEKEKIYLSINNTIVFKTKENVFLKNLLKFKKITWLIFFFSFFFSSIVDFFSFGVGSVDVNSILISVSPFLDLKKKKINLNFFFEFLLKSSLFGGSNNLTLLDLWGVDYIERKKFRFEVNYYFLNLYTNVKFYFKFSVSQFFFVQSISKNFSSANWLEREVYDMFGVIFLENKDLRRILTDYGFKNNPLKKDYPLVGFYQVRYNDVLKTIVMEKINLMQELRLFNFSSPWIVDQEGARIKVE